MEREMEMEMEMDEYTSLDPVPLSSETSSSDWPSCFSLSFALFLTFVSIACLMTLSSCGDIQIGDQMMVRMISGMAVKWTKVCFT